MCTFDLDELVRDCLEELTDDTTFPVRVQLQVADIQRHRFSDFLHVGTLVESVGLLADEELGSTPWLSDGISEEAGLNLKRVIDAWADVYDLHPPLEMYQAFHPDTPTTPVELRILDGSGRYELDTDTPT